VRLQFGVDGLGQAGLGKADDFRAFDAEKPFQVRAGEVLDHRVMRKVSQDFFANVFGGVVGNQHEVQNAFAASQGFAANQQLAQLQDEREETLDGFDWDRVVHSAFPWSGVPGRRASGSPLLAGGTPVLPSFALTPPSL